MFQILDSVLSRSAEKVQVLHSSNEGFIFRSNIFLPFFNWLSNWYSLIERRALSTLFAVCLMPTTTDVISKRCINK